MEYTSLILVHVFFAILWAGGGILLGFFLVPAVIEAGPTGGAVMAGVMKRKFPMFMTTSALLVLVSGLRLYMVRFSAAWLTTPEGIALTLGAVLAIGAFVIGLFVQKPATLRLGALAAEIAAAGGTPNPEKVAELNLARARLGRVARVNAWHLIGAALLMASHRLLAQLG